MSSIPNRRSNLHHRVQARALLGSPHFVVQTALGCKLTKECMDVCR